MCMGTPSKKCYSKIGRDAPRSAGVLPMIASLMKHRHAVFAAALGMAVASLTLPGADAVPDRPPPGGVDGIPSRNMVNLRERNLPIDWSVEEGKLKNIKWMADVGSNTFGSPVVAHGKVFVATNNARPRDLNVKEKKPVLMAFREADGKFLWQIAHDCPDAPIFCPGD